MLLNRLAKNKPDEVGTFTLYLIVAIVVATVGIKVFNWIDPEPHVQLLTDAPGLVQLTNLDDLNRYTDTEVTPPIITMESELYVIGVYSEENKSFAPGTVSLVYVHDGWRTFEIDYEPGATLQEGAINTFGIDELETITLAQDTKASFANLRALQSCVQPKETFPGMCRISKQLFFEHNGSLVTISADSEHLSQGEMLLIAMSIIESDVE